MSRPADSSGYPRSAAVISRSWRLSPASTRRATLAGSSPRRRARSSGSMSSTSWRKLSSRSPSRISCWCTGSSASNTASARSRGRSRNTTAFSARPRRASCSAMSSVPVSARCRCSAARSCARLSTARSAIGPPAPGWCARSPGPTPDAGRPRRSSLATRLRHAQRDPRTLVRAVRPRRAGPEGGGRRGPGPVTGPGTDAGHRPHPETTFRRHPGDTPEKGQPR